MHAENKTERSEWVNTGDVASSSVAPRGNCTSAFNLFLGCVLHRELTSARLRKQFTLADVAICGGLAARNAKSTIDACEITRPLMNSNLPRTRFTTRIVCAVMNGRATENPRLAWPMVSDGGVRSVVNDSQVKWIYAIYKV